MKLTIHHIHRFQVLELSQSHFDDNRAMIALPYIHVASAREIWELCAEWMYM